MLSAFSTVHETDVPWNKAVQQTGVVTSQEKTFEMCSTKAGNVVAVAIDMEATHGLFSVHLMADIQK